MNIHIRHVDGGVSYPNADHYHLDDHNGTLRVITHGDNIVFSPNYWQSFVVDPQSDDPLGLKDI